MIVLDTCAIIWKNLTPNKIPRKTQKAISDAEKNDALVICDISFWEIAMLMNKGRLKVEFPYLEFMKLILESTQFTIQGITPEIADLSSSFVGQMSSDPADRIICATTILANATLVTSDKILKKSSLVRTLWN